jgi:ribonuclease D
MKNTTNIRDEDLLQFIDIFNENENNLMQPNYSPSGNKTHLTKIASMKFFK